MKMLAPILGEVTKFFSLKSSGPIVHPKGVAAKLAENFFC